MLWTTDDLITSIKNRAQATDTTNTNNINASKNLLILATEEMRIKILPAMLRVNKEFFVVENSTPVVANQANYPLPTRATGNTLRSIRLVNGTTDAPFVAMERDLLPTLPAGQILGYFFENNNIVLYPTPTASAAGQTIWTRYFIRPSRLEQTVNCAQITSITGNQVTVNAIPSTWQVGSTCDFIRQINPYPCNAIDQAITALSGQTITFANNVPSDSQVNDWIALSEYTPLPQIPEELQPILSQLVVCKLLEAIGDRQGLAVARADLKDDFENALTLLTPRDQSHPEKIVGTNWRRLQVVRGFLR